VRQAAGVCGRYGRREGESRRAAGSGMRYAMRAVKTATRTEGARRRQAKQRVAQWRTAQRGRSPERAVKAARGEMPQARRTRYAKRSARPNQTICGVHVARVQACGAVVVNGVAGGTAAVTSEPRNRTKQSAVKAAAARQNARAVTMRRCM